MYKKDLLLKAYNHSATSAPTATDDQTKGYLPGSTWVDTTNDLAYTCVDGSTNAAVWKSGGDSLYAGSGTIPSGATSTITDTWTIEAPNTFTAPHLQIKSTNTTTSLHNFWNYGYPIHSFKTNTTDWWIANSEGSNIANDGEFYIYNEPNDLNVFTATPTGTIILGGGADVAAVNGEKISVQDDVYFDDVIIQHAPSVAVVDTRLNNNNFSFYVSSGELKARYKDNLGTAADLTIGGGGDSIYTADGIVTGDRVVDLDGNKLSLQGDTLISGKLELSTTDDGFLMPRLTTAQKTAIVTPDTHLMVFDTDLGGIQRWNGTQWVGVSSGYGIVSTTDSGGNPQFYATVKAAYDAGLGSIKLHTDYEETTSNPINIVDGRNIDLNGFTYTYNVADNTSIFEDSTQNNSIRIANGRLIRKNGTGTDYVINCNLTQTRIDILNVYAENESGFCLNLKTTLNGSGSEFVSNNTSGNGFFFSNTSVILFGKYINKNNGGTQFNGDEIKFAEFVCLGSGMNYMGGNIFNSRFISNTGRALLTSTNAKIYDSYLESSLSNALDMRNNAEIYNSTLVSNGVICATTIGSTATKMVKCNIKGSNSAYSVLAPSLIQDCTIVNSGSGKAIEGGSQATQIINNVIKLEVGTADAIDVNANVNSLVSDNTIFVNDPTAVGIVSLNVDIYVMNNKIKGTTLDIDLGSGTNLWTATPDAAGNQAQV